MKRYSKSDKTTYERLMKCLFLLNVKATLLTCEHTQKLNKSFLGLPDGLKEINKKLTQISLKNADSMYDSITNIIAEKHEDASNKSMFYRNTSIKAYAKLNDLMQRFKTHLTAKVPLETLTREDPFTEFDAHQHLTTYTHLPLHLPARSPKTPEETPEEENNTSHPKP